MTKVACIGAGLVGSAWSVVFARAGHDVSIFDASKDEVEARALPRAKTTLKLLEKAGFLSEPVETVLARIAPAASLKAAVDGAAYVQESVREEIRIKRDVFAALDEAAPQNAILASSTSAIKGSDFMEGLKGRSRALVAHPVNPPSLIPLVELCPTPWTDKDVVVEAKTFLEDAGMKPIMVNKEIDGFILNRLQYTLVAEAMHLIGEGYCSAEDIDRVMTDGLALRWATIGPFQVSHLNASEGFQGFVDQLGPMMKHIGQSARTDYSWGPDLVTDIHAQLADQTPVEDIPSRQAERDKGILAVRRMQAER